MPRGCQNDQKGPEKCRRRRHDRRQSFWRYDVVREVRCRFGRYKVVSGGTKPFRESISRKKSWFYEENLQRVTIWRIFLSFLVKLRITVIWRIFFWNSILRLENLLDLGDFTNFFSFRFPFWKKTSSQEVNSWRKVNQKSAGCRDS